MNLKEIRVSRKLKVQEVSDYLCCFPSVYSRYENGKREPSIDILLKLSKLYGVSVDCLIGNDEVVDTSISGYMDTSGGAVPATVSEELAASISMQEQEKKRETLFGRLLEMEVTMMSETTNEDRMYPIEMTLQGAHCCISIGKDVIKALGKPSHVSIIISDSHDSLSVFPCDEDDVMAFRVPLKLFTDHKCVMKINSKQFVHGIMRTNQMDTSKTYVLSGEFLEEKNTAVFSLEEGVSLRTQKGVAQP